MPLWVPSVLLSAESTKLGILRPLPSQYSCSSLRFKIIITGTNKTPLKSLFSHESHWAITYSAGSMSALGQAIEKTAVESKLGVLQNFSPF